MNFILKKITPFLKNWKTTLSGLALIGHGLTTIFESLHKAADGNALSLEAMQLAVGEIIAGFGLIAARDADKSSQDSKIR